MKLSKTFLKLLAVGTVLACAFPSAFAQVKLATKPAPKAKRVQIVTYDTTPRAPTTSLDYCGFNPPRRPYKVIAVLTCEGAPNQEAVMTAAIYYRARQIGANAVQDAGTIRTVHMGYYFFYTAPARRCVFRDYAIVYTDQ